MDPSIAIPGYGLIEAFFTVGGTMLIGFVLGYVCVGLFVYDYVDDDFEGEMSEEERQTRTRNRCNSEGYESVALIPLKSGDDVIGLLQLNDHRSTVE